MVPFISPQDPNDRALLMHIARPSRSGLVARIVALVAAGVLCATPLHAADEPAWFTENKAQATPLDVVHKDAKGGARLNWIGGYLEVVGYGTVDMARVKSHTQAGLLAMEAARAEAQAKLVSTIEGVRVSAATIVKDKMTESTGIATRVQGFLQGAFAISEDVAWEDDAPRDGQLGANPLVVKGVSLGSDGSSDVVVSEEDALRIYAADTRGGEFLSAGRVAFVVN